MADAVIGALRVLLGVDTAAFTAGFEGANKQLEKFAHDLTDNLGKAALAGGAALAGMAGGIGIAVKHSIDQMDELGKMSQKIGVPVEKLSELKVAAELSDVSVESLSKSMGFLSKNMVAAASGGVGPAASAFNALGISMTTLKQNDPSTVMSAIAGKFSEFQDGATKTALAIAIFGRAGKDMIPLLNEGAAGFDKAKQNAIDFGAVLSTQTTKQAQEFNDNLKLFGIISQGVANQLATALLPILVEVSDKMVEWARNNDLVSTTSNYLLRVIALTADNFKFLIEVAKVFIEYKLVTTFFNVAVMVYEFGKALYAAAAAGQILNIVKSVSISKLAAFAAVVLYATGNLDPFIEKVKELAGVVASMIPAGVGEGIAKGLAALNIDVSALQGNLDGLKSSSDKANEGLKNLKPPPVFDPSSSKSAQDFNQELLKIGMKARELRGDFDGLAPGFTAAAVQLKLIKDTGEGFSGTVDSLTPKMQQLNSALLGLFGAQLTKDALSPLEQYEKQINRVQMAFDQGKISAEVFGDASAKAAAKMVEVYGNAASTAAGNFADFFKTVGQGNETMFMIGKAFSISQAIINTYVGATKALAELGPILGPIAAAGMVAAGLAQVAKIVAEKPAGKMALGGSFQVKGAGGVDSQMVPIMATPGERVNIDQNKYGDTGMGGNTLTVQGISAKDYYKGDVLRDIINNINQAISDGYKIRIA